MAINKKKGNDPLSIERRGIEHVDEESRHGHPRSQFSIRCSPVIYLAPIFIGGIAIYQGLGLAGTVIAILSANVLGSMATGVCAAMGPKRGMPQMVMSRLSFGYHGNYVPAICASLMTLGYTTVGTIVGTKALVDLTGLPFVPLVVFLVFLSLIFAIYGHDLLHLVARWSTWIGAVLLLVTTAFVFAHGIGESGATALSGRAYWLVWLSQFAIVFSYTASWNIYASDYSRYLPSSTSFASVFGYASLGLFTGASWMMILGALLATTAPEGVLAGFGAVLPSALLMIALIALTIASLSHNAVTLYSFSMQTITWDFPLSRVPLAILAAVIVSLSAIFLGRIGFVDHLTTFLLVLSYFVVPWFALVLIDFSLESSRPYVDADVFYRSDGPLKGVRWAAMGAFLGGIIVSSPFMHSSMYEGPVAQALGGADISYFVSFAAAGIIYALAKTVSPQRNSFQTSK